MSIPRRGVKVMDNNIKPKTGKAQPHSKMAASGQIVDPYPEIMTQKIKKKKKKDAINSEITFILEHKPEFRGLV